MCVYVCVCVRACECARVCVRERERARERIILIMAERPEHVAEASEEV
jgi:hypothetical protein